MKRLMVILVVAIVTWAPEQTYSQPQEPVDVASELEEIFKGLVQCRDEIADLEDNMRAIPNEFSALHEAGLLVRQRLGASVGGKLVSLMSKWKQCKRKSKASFLHTDCFGIAVSDSLKWRRL